MKKQIVVEIIIFLYLVLFLYAAGTKLLDYDRSVAQLAQSPLLTPYADWIAWFVPLCEIVVAILLMISRTRRSGLYAAFGMMVMFTFYIIAILTFSEELPCACGGILSSLHWKEHLVFNLVFVILSVIGIALINKEDKADKTIAA